jgi:membrane protein CcdC involved in cytochrome C biogenesis
MAIAVIFIRMKATEKPVTKKKIILPPLFMSTGALMFVFPVFRVSLLQFTEALLVGAIFSILLIKTTHFEVRDNDIYVKRSKAFAIILIGLLIIRIGLKVVLTSTINIGEIGGMFWILAFGMIVPWRLAMYRKYEKLESQLLGYNKQEHT